MARVSAGPTHSSLCDSDSDSADDDDAADYDFGGDDGSFSSMLGAAEVAEQRQQRRPTVVERVVGSVAAFRRKTVSSARKSTATAMRKPLTHGSVRSKWASGECRTALDLKLRLAHDVASGMAFIHSLGHVHRGGGVHACVCVCVCLSVYVCVCVSV